MIPPRYSDDTPIGEKRVFDLLRNDPDTKDWVVLHSYAISRHETKRAAEIDIVVLAPDLGVLCLEIKGSRVSRNEGVWDYGYKTSKKGPFRQASSAMHALMACLQNQDSSCRTVLFWSGVIFTAQSFREKSPEWHSWQYIDGPDLTRFPISRLLRTMLEKAHTHSASRHGSQHWYDAIDSRPSPGQITRLIEVMRGDFEAVSSPKDLVRQTEQTITRLTEEQYTVLDSLEDNDRILVNGLAGTGKSLLAIEAARRAALEGSSVLLVCFNKLLGEWMSAEVKAESVSTGKRIHAVHLHGLMRDIERGPVPQNAGKDYWARELPELTLYKLWDSPDAKRYDVLVVDEAQDILVAEYLDVLSELLSGGLAGGRWLMFGDFENQAIYLEQPVRSGDELLKLLAERAPHHARHRLSVNCRNAEKIASALTLVCDIKPGYRRTIQDIDGADVEPYFWTEDGDQKEKLRSILRDLRKEFDTNEIVVLSTRKDASSCAGQMAADGDSGLIALRNQHSTASAISFVTIHAFKGLEAPAIVVTDITSLADEQRPLLYVAMSRARVRLILLMQEPCRSVYKQLFLRNLAAGGRK